MQPRLTLTRFTQLAGVGAIVIALLTLLGWWLGIGPLTYIRAGWRTMKPATAALCLMAGVALVLLGTESRRRQTGRAPPAGLRAARYVCAGLCGAMALVAVVSKALGFQVGIDVLLTGRQVGMPLGRTALSYVLISAGLLAADKVTARGHSPTQMLALISGSISLLAVFGYAFSLPELHGPVMSSVAGGMALQNAASIFLLSAGMLVAHPDVGFVAALTSRYAGGIVARRLLLGLVAFTPIAILVILGRHLGWYGDPAVAPALTFLALVEGAALIVVTAVRMNAYDIRQRTIEQLLRESEQRLHQLFGLAPDGIFIANLEARYTDVNDAGCRLLGYRREEIVGKMITDFVPPEQVPRLWVDRDKLLSGTPVVTSDWLLRHRSGDYIPVEVSAGLLPDGRWQGFVRDNRERRELERLREEWASLVAHDLRQPASAISLSAEALGRSQATNLPEKERKSLERIRSSAARLNRMIEDLLDASRIEAKRLTVSPRAFDLAGLATTVAESMHETLGGRQIRVAADPEVHAWADSDRIQQVLINLIANAAKYGDPDTDILVDVENTDDSVAVSVTNRGPGIPAEEIPQLFSRFGRTTGARATGTPGTGLGLYIAKGLIEAHGGRIWVDSTLGEVTTFHFTVARAGPVDQSTTGVEPPAHS